MSSNFTARHKVRVALVGVGNCASSLVQGVHFYRQVPDTERLFNGSRDYRVARDGAQMIRHLRTLLTDEEKRKRQATHGLATIRSRHSCAHRVRELLQIHGQVLAERRKVVVPATRLFRRHSSLISEATAS